MSVLIQNRHPYTENLNSEAPGTSETRFYIAEMMKEDQNKGKRVMEEKRHTVTARLQQSLPMELHVHRWFACILAYINFQLPGMRGTEYHATAEQCISAVQNKTLTGVTDKLPTCRRTRSCRLPCCEQLHSAQGQYGACRPTSGQLQSA